MNKYFIILIFFTNSISSQTFPNPATLSTGQGTSGSIDPIWSVSQLFTNNPPNPIGLNYTPALINNNCAPGTWVEPSSLPSPINNGNWITANIGSPCNFNTSNGYIYFRLKLDLPASCNGKSIAINGNYKLFLSGYVDNIISDVFVNGTSIGISGGAFLPGTQLNMALAGPWVSGTNYVDILVLNMPGPGQNPYGLLMVADYSANLNSDIDGDGITDLYDKCPCLPGVLPDGCCASVITPTGNSVQSFCNGAKIEDLSANGTNIKWYTTPSGGNPIINTTLLENNSNYYASQIDSNTGCESSRFAVKVNLNDLPPTPFGSTFQQFCIENSPKIENLVLNTNQLIWYDSSINGNVLPLNHLLGNGEIVYAESVDNITNCNSSERLKVEVSIVNSELNYYNLITVNNNSSNYKLTIIGIENFPKNEIQIFNRYGELVWNGSNYNNTSNYFIGKANINRIIEENNYLPTGTYYFILKYSSPCAKKELKGFFQIDNVN